MFKLLIFDLDGTLIDSAQDITNATNELLQLYQKPLVSKAKVITYIGDGLRRLIHEDFAELSPSLIEDRYQEFLQIYGRHLLNHSTVYPGAMDFLQRWNGSMAIVTNKPALYTQQVLEGLGLDRFSWLRVFGADSLPRRKPDPLPLLEVMRAGGFSAQETVMIGDGAPDIRAANAAQVRSIGIEFGYSIPQKLLELGATTTLGHFNQLETILKQTWKN